MKRTVLATAIWAVACSGGSSTHRDGGAVDAGFWADDAYYEEPCNILTGTGCLSGRKCTWLVDYFAGVEAVGHIGCAPDGTVAVGSACTRNAPGSAGYDDCARGGYCVGPEAGGSGACEAICDQAGGAPACGSGFVCIPTDGLFGWRGMPSAAGLCEVACDPLADNNFLGFAGNNRTGSACGSDGTPVGSGYIYAKGCYAYANDTDGATRWSCRPQLNPTRFHRTSCDATRHAGDASTCASAPSEGKLDGCAAGYEPVFVDAEGSTQLDCMAMCAPAPCYNAGHVTDDLPMCGPALANLPGDPTSAHACDPANLQAASFTPASGSSNGEQCFYSWLFEFDQTHFFASSPTSDTVGYCVDHSKYTYDPMGGSNATTEWPRCDRIGLGPLGYGVLWQMSDATSFGCVDTATARAAGDLTFGGKARFVRPLELRLPYRRAMP